MQSFRLRHSDKLVWIFLTGVVVILGIVVFLTVKGQNLFEKRLQYRTIFRDGGGLSTGTTVTISGMEVGMVRHLTLNEENNVEVTFEVMERFADRIREDSRVGVQGVGGFGGGVFGGFGSVFGFAGGFGILGDLEGLYGVVGGGFGFL